MTEMQVYASYAWKVEEQTQILDKLTTVCQSHNIRILRDKDEIGYRESIQAYMSQLVASDAIILVLSDAYFKSQYCMYELCEIYKRKDFLKRVYPIVIDGTRFHKANERIPYIRHWEQEVAELNDGLKSIRTGNMSAASLAEIKEYEDFARMIDNLLVALGDMSALTQDVHVNSDFQELIKKLQASIVVSASSDEDENKNNKECMLLISDSLPTIAGKFIGRKKEIKMLNQAWKNKSESIVQLIASGGTGKTKLIRHWLNLIKPKNFITWSFHSQGENENTQTSSTLFFEHAFHRLQSQKNKFWSEEAKGERLAELLRQHQCLLVLDGIEPLQYSVAPKVGELKDRAIRQLLKSISNNPECLCVITSRIAIHDISDYDTVNTYNLSNLNLFDSITLLKSFLVKKVSKRDVASLCASYNKHALTITLLGQLIKIHHNGDIRKFREPKKIIGENGNKNEYSAFKIMYSYEECFRNQHELSLLYCLGLFDHPVSHDVLMYLCKSQIPELTLGITESAWARAIDNLKNNYYLITTCDYDNNQLDSHPLIREYFGDQLKTKHYSAWITANEILYKYYQLITLNYTPDDIKDIQQLIHAVKHGCLANLHQQAFDAVYYKRISRGKTYYLHKIGACTDDLAVLSSFLEKNWTLVHTGIKPSDQAFILRTIAHRLRSLGWIEQCIEPFNASLGIYRRLANKSKIAKTESDLIEPYLTLGYIGKAIKLAESGVKKNYHIDPVLDRRLRRVSVYARALHQSGQYEEAVFYFREAEKIQKQYKPNIKYLMGLSGFRYCELLIENNQCEDALHHAREGLSLAEKQLPDDKPYTLFIGLNKLILGRAILKSGGGEEAAGFIKEALEDLRKANDQDHLPRGLLMCANLNCTIRDFEKAHQRLKEVLEIAKPNGMRLHIVDCYLEYVNLYLAEGKLAKAQEYLKNAKALIEETGYHRRDAELADLQAQLQALSLSTV